MDLNPGVGVWSRKLHDFLEPRRHIMMDVDAEFYRPFLDDLLSKDGVQLVPYSGIEWKRLSDMLRTQLSNLEGRPKGEKPTRNDSLLVIANLTAHPKKKYLSFENVSMMVLFQFIASIRMQSLFQHYGLVRMLVWANDEDKFRVLPSSVIRRKRSAVEAEFSCEWVHEVAGLDPTTDDGQSLRDDWINIESGHNVLQRMKTAGLKMPKGRETRMYSQLQASPELAGQRLAGERLPILKRPFRHELAKMQGSKKQMSSKDLLRLSALARRAKYADHELEIYLGFLQEHSRAMRLGELSASGEEFKAADSAWNERLDGLKKNLHNEINLMLDGLHLFRQDPPVMLTDRRQYEPLSIKEDEFFPNIPCTLMDIQPKAMHPLLLQHGPNSTHSGDMSELLLTHALSNPTGLVTDAMGTMWPGFADQASQCPSLLDPSRGGSPISRNGELRVRVMNEAQWIEVMEAWMDWPFRPSYHQLMGKLVNGVDLHDVDEDELPATMSFMA